MHRKLSFAFAFVLVVVAIVSTKGCGGSGGDTPITLKVGSIATAVVRGEARAYPDDAVQSDNNFAFAKVDGIKLNLRRIQALKTGNNEMDMVDFGAGKEVTIAPGTDNTVPITEAASIDSGVTYNGVKVRYDNSYKVKAYCRTATKLVYTTATGIMTMPVGSAGAAPPAEYDY